MTDSTADRIIRHLKELDSQIKALAIELNKRIQPDSRLRDNHIRVLAENRNLRKQLKEANSFFEK